MSSNDECTPGDETSTKPTWNTTVYTVGVLQTSAHVFGPIDATLEFRIHDCSGASQVLKASNFYYSSTVSTTGQVGSLCSTEIEWKYRPSESKQGIVQC